MNHPVVDSKAASEKIAQIIAPYFAGYIERNRYDFLSSPSHADQACELIAHKLKKQPSPNISIEDVQNLVLGKYVAPERCRAICEELMAGEMAGLRVPQISAVLKYMEQLPLIAENTDAPAQAVQEEQARLEVIARKRAAKSVLNAKQIEKYRAFNPQAVPPDT